MPARDRFLASCGKVMSAFNPFLCLCLLRFGTYRACKRHARDVAATVLDQAARSDRMPAAVASCASSYVVSEQPPPAPSPGHFVVVSAAGGVGRHAQLVRLPAVHRPPLPLRPAALMEVALHSVLRPLHQLALAPALAPQRRLCFHPLHCLHPAPEAPHTAVPLPLAGRHPAHSQRLHEPAHGVVPLIGVQPAHHPSSRRRSARVAERHQTRGEVAAVPQRGLQPTQSVSRLLSCFLVYPTSTPFHLLSRTTAGSKACGGGTAARTSSAAAASPLVSATCEAAIRSVSAPSASASAAALHSSAMASRARCAPMVEARSNSATVCLPSIC